MTSIGERIERKTTPPNEIKGVIVACYKKDYWLAKIAIASIRYFYKEIPIYILLDFARGAFSISEVQQRFNVQALKLNRSKWGNP